MLAPARFKTFQDAYIGVLEYVSHHYEYRNSPRGNASHECIGLSFQLSNPRERSLYLPARKVNPAFHFAEALWYLGGRDDLAMMAHYSPRMREFSRDGKTIPSAYGSRIFNAAGANSSQFETVLRLLRTEEDSKRAVLQVFRPEELVRQDNPDVSCVIALHLLVRDERLHMVCYMRANDANRGLVADAFSFTFIQEYAAVLLGLKLGTYTHHVGSMHIGDRDMDRVARILAATDASPRTRRSEFAFPAMPAGTSAATIATVLAHEEALRHNEIGYRPDDIAAMELPSYWRQIVLVFEIHRQIAYNRDRTVSEAALEALHPGLRWLVANKWPKHVPSSARSTQ
ncbi:thymidylate synthase [Streptomyces sp. MS19]|uniref:thymidylate synthase n=1 Tax=Streptomyces sp. MS19 TaxID=3385972 RepID=UPI00399F0FFF